jgi:hypothetical protein
LATEDRPSQTAPQADLKAADRSVAELVTRISDNASTLVREEIELAKAEIEIKVRRLGVGAVVAVVAGFFVLLAVIYAFEGLAWGLNDFFDSLWLGFLIVTVLLLVLAAIGGFVASRAFKAGPPTPDQAIEEARLIREAFEHVEAGDAANGEAEASATATPASEVKAPSEPAANNRQ